jgi:hypothetical protein
MTLGVIEYLNTDKMPGVLKSGHFLFISVFIVLYLVSLLLLCKLVHDFFYGSDSIFSICVSSAED